MVLWLCSNSFETMLDNSHVGSLCLYMATWCAPLDGWVPNYTIPIFFWSLGPIAWNVLMGHQGIVHQHNARPCVAIKLLPSLSVHDCSLRITYSCYLIVAMFSLCFISILVWVKTRLLHTSSASCYSQSSIYAISHSLGSSNWYTLIFDSNCLTVW